MAIDVELHEGQKWIEQELIKELIKIKWQWNSGRQLHILQVEIGGKQVRPCEFTENEVRDCLADGEIQKTIRKRLKKSAE